MKNAKDLFNTSQIIFVVSVIFTWAFGAIGLLVAVAFRFVFVKALERGLPTGQAPIAPTRKTMNIFGQIFIYYSALGFIDYDDPAVIGVSVIFIIIGIVLYVKSYEGSFPASSPIPSQPPLHSSKAFQEALDPYAYIRNLSRCYGLNLSESDINDICLSDDPLSAMSSKVSPGYQPVEQFVVEIDKFISDILMHVGASPFEMYEAHTYFIDSLQSLTEESMHAIADQFSAVTCSTMPFLKDKINYELAALGVIMQYAINTQNQILQNKVTQYRKERGFIS